MKAVWPRSTTRAVWPDRFPLWIASERTRPLVSASTPSTSTNNLTETHQRLLKQRLTRDPLHHGGEIGGERGVEELQHLTSNPVVGRSIELSQIAGPSNQLVSRFKITEFDSEPRSGQG